MSMVVSHLVRSPLSWPAWPTDPTQHCHPPDRAAGTLDPATGEGACTEDQTSCPCQKC